MKTQVPPVLTIEQKHSYDYIIRSGLAGGIAGCAGKSLIAPLDRVKILFQTSSPEFRKYSGARMGLWRAAKTIYTHDGVLGLFQGHSATLLRIFPYAAIKFVAYEQIRSLLIPTPKHETSVRRVLSGSLAGVSSVFFTYPLELIRVRLAYETRADHKTTISQLCKYIYNEGRTTENPTGRGLQNFYRGFIPTILGILPYAGVSFWTHDTVHDIFRSSLLARYAVSQPESDGRRYPLKVWAQLTAGGLAGMISQTASYPLEVVRRRMQVGGALGDGSFAKILPTIKMIWLEKGTRGFFVGLTIGYVKVIPMVSCSFFVYERTKFLLGI
ncbi:mitochondrial carrier domain-containing protein [Dipodascopsis tothii]|uniref:mitochondrial carrier domain-containing protein n=1 Tax=Dipodascopsis tothii TaxID=44089 RepID=UPI0034CF193B